MTPLLVGTLLVAGIAAAAWVFFSRHGQMRLDPLDEADRRINELEDSLHRLQGTITHAISG